MIHLTCPTAKFVLLCVVDDASGVMRCPLGQKEPPGLGAEVRPLIPINVQIVELAESFFAKQLARHIHIEQEFADPLGATASDYTLYLARLHPESGIVAPKDWPTMPQLLRGLSGRMRIPYLRAWQVLAGGLHLNTKAVDAAEVAKYFEDDQV